MVTIFFLLSLLCGVIVAAVGAKLFADTRKGASFMGITLAAPRPAIVAIVLGVIVILGSLIVFLSLSSNVTKLCEDVESIEGKLSGTETRLEAANENIETLKKDLETEKAGVEEARKQIKTLQDDIKAKEEEGVVESGKAEQLEEALKSLKAQFSEKNKEAQTLASDLAMTKGQLEAAGQETEKVRAELEEMKEFARDFKALVEEEEAAPSGTVRKLYFKLRELLNKYKQR